MCAKKDEISHHLQSDRSGERLMTCWFGRKFDDVMLSNILPHHYDIRYHGTTCYMSHPSPCHHVLHGRDMDIILVSVSLQRIRHKINDHQKHFHWRKVICPLLQLYKRCYYSLAGNRNALVYYSQLQFT